MKYWLYLAVVLALAGCGNTTVVHERDSDDGAYTQEDLKHDTADVYRPGDTGKDDDGVDKSSHDKPLHSGTVKANPGHTTAEPVKPKDNPPGKPGSEVEKPTHDPKEQPGDNGKHSPHEKPKPKVEQPKKDRTKVIMQFISDVSMRMDALEKTQLWKEFLRQKKKFTDRCDRALEKGNDDRGKSAEAAWTEAIKAWYEVRYTYELFIHVNWKAAKDFEPGAGLNFEDLKVYSDEQLKSADCAQTDAAYELAEPEVKEVRQFQTDVLKYDLVASKVYINPKYEKKWADEKKKWQDATEGKFDEKDLKKYGG